MRQLQRGPRFVTGRIDEDGLIILTREDGSTSVVPGVICVSGAHIVDNGDGTDTVTIGE